MGTHFALLHFEIFLRGIWVIRISNFGIFQAFGMYFLSVLASW